MFQIRTRLLLPQQQTSTPPTESGIAPRPPSERTRAQHQTAGFLETPSAEGSPPQMFRSLWSRATNFFRSSPTVDELLREFFRLHWSKTAAARQIDSLIRHRVRPPHGGVRLAGLRCSEVTRELAREWFSAQHATPRAANRGLRMIRQAWRELLPDTPCPFDRVRVFPERFRTRCFTDDERERFMTALASLRARDGRGKLHRVTADALFTLAVTGARSSEILALRVDQCDLAVGIAVLDEHKTADEDGSRVIHLGAALDLIRQRCAATEGRFVFPSHGRSGHLVKVSSAFHRVCREAGIVRTRDLVVHMLRRDFASLALRDGSSLRVLQRALGHRDPKTTARYAMVAEDLAHELVAKVGARMGGARW